MRGGQLSDEAICFGCCAITVLCTLFLQLAVLGYGVFVASLALQAASDARAEADQATAAGLLPTCVWNYNQRTHLPQRALMAVELGHGLAFTRSQRRPARGKFWIDTRKRSWQH